ncbi:MULTISPECIES: hypothetical protein [Kamptonema]|uniref:hypothetical protein n=1 Tax=Kamptonema TaxID=1501433 RepID=UPI0001DACF4C|nr:MULTISPECIES: hypothetical protein [Kamptonema]CBN57005.1 hypothetical protein OSCI_3280015 [Kamptonema sp. PCC 6506]
MTRQATTNTSESRPISEIVAEIAKRELAQLNPDYRVAFHEVGAAAETEKSLRFEELSAEEQDAIRNALVRAGGVSA